MMMDLGKNRESKKGCSLRGTLVYYKCMGGCTGTIYNTKYNIFAFSMN